MLTIELNEDGDVVEIHCNASGLASLREALDRLLESPEQTNHEHLMTPAWGGSELSEDVQGEGNRLVHHVKLHYWGGA